MLDKWKEWIESYQLPDDVHWYKMNGKLIFTISGYHVVETNYVYLSDLKDVYVKGVRLDDLCSEAQVHRAIANKVLEIQVDVKSPKSYKTYWFGDKQHIIAP